MSEEKDYVKYSAEHALLLEQENIELRRTDYLHETIWQKEKIASLESRLADAEKWIESCHRVEAERVKTISDLESRLKAQEVIKQGMWDAQTRQCEEIQSLEQRLSQAEAELKEWRDDQASCMNERCGDEVHCTCVPSLRRRLSHLMDVAKKLVAQIDAEGGHGYAVHGLCDKLKAEWDGIKKDGGK